MVWNIPENPGERKNPITITDDWIIRDKMIADKIKNLREKQGLTQSSLSKQLGITRSSVNAWELGISVPSTQYLVELAYLFSVSTDCLLDLNNTATVSVAGLSEKDVQLICEIIQHLRNKNTSD